MSEFFKRKFAELSAAQVKRLMTGMAMAITEECRIAGVEHPRFALFILNDPDQDYCIASCDRNEAIVEVMDACVRTMDGSVTNESTVSFKRSQPEETN